jgi:SAM-dependent methyltransferase
VAPVFLAWLARPPGQRWLDVGCGTGALAEAILLHCAPACVTGVDPSRGFLARAREQLQGRVVFHQCSAAVMALPDGCMDATVSALVLNFVPDPAAALREMVRVTADGGVLAVYVWDYAGRMELMRHFWDCAASLDPAAAALDEGTRFPLCRPEALAAAFTGAGLATVDAVAIEVPTVFDSFEAYWTPFLGGAGPAPAYVTSLADGPREELRALLRQRLPARADGSIALVARAWAVRGQVFH